MANKDATNRRRPTREVGRAGQRLSWAPRLLPRGDGTAREEATSHLTGGRQRLLHIAFVEGRNRRATGLRFGAMKGRRCHSLFLLLDSSRRSDYPHVNGHDAHE